MLVVESPSELDNLISYGSFVVIGIDIAASVRGLDDERAALASALPATKCLAWIFGPGELEGMVVNGVLKPKLNLQFLLVGHVLPAPPDAYAAVPIAPAPPHPETGRPPVQPSSPLPWPDCHIYTTRSVEATVSRVYPGQTRDPVPTLDGNQSQAVFTAYYEDAQTADVGEAAEVAALGVVVRQAPGIPIDLIFEPEYDDEFLSDSEVFCKILAVHEQ